MTTKVLVLVDVVQPDREVHIHIETRDEHGRFVRPDQPQQVVTGPSVGYVETYIHDGAQIVVTEHIRHHTEIVEKEVPKNAEEPNT
jgi:hypothetical protein